VPLEHDSSSIRTDNEHIGKAESQGNSKQSRLNRMLQVLLYTPAGEKSGMEMHKQKKENNLQRRHNHTSFAKGLEKWISAACDFRRARRMERLQTVLIRKYHGKSFD
jgi:hypothetical protein